jgi:hypothetical protein
MVWAGICVDGFTQLKIVRGTLDAVKYRDDILYPIFLPFDLQLLNTHICIWQWYCLSFDIQLLTHINIWIPWPDTNMGQKL